MRPFRCRLLRIISCNEDANKSEASGGKAESRCLIAIQNATLQDLVQRVTFSLANPGDIDL